MTAPKEGGGMAGRAMKGLAWTSSGTAAQMVLQVAVVILLARLLSPAEFGVVSMALVVIGFSELIVELGMSSAVVQRPQLEERHVRTAFTVSMLSGLVLCVVLVLAAPLIAAFVRMPTLVPILRALALGFIVRGPSVVSTALLQRAMAFRSIAMIRLASYVLGYAVVGVSLALAGFGVWALVAANLGQAALQSGLSFATQPHALRPALDRRSLGEMSAFASGMTLTQVANYFGRQGDNFLVGKLLGAAPLGIYGRAYQLMAMPANFFGQAFSTVLFPAFARIQEDPARTAGAFERGTRLIALVLLPFGAVTYALGPEIVAFLLGPRWDAVVAPFQVLVAGTFFRTAYKLNNAVAVACGAVHRTALQQVIYGAAVLAGAWIGHFFGLVGVAYGVLGAVVLHYVLSAWVVTTLAPVRWGTLARSLASALPLALLLGGAAALAAHLGRVNALPALVTLAAAGAVVVALSALVLRFAPEAVLGAGTVAVLREAGSRVPGRLPGARRIHAWAAGGGAR